MSAIREGIRRQNRALAELSSEGLWKGSERRAAFRAIVEKAAQTLQVGRAGIWLFDLSRTHLVCADVYLAVEDRHESGHQRAELDHPTYFAALSSARAIAADDVRVHPHTKEFLGGYLATCGIGALLDAPVMVRGRCVGVVCLEHLGGPRTWRDDEISFAGSMADFTALVLESEQRQQAERALDEQQALHRQALSAARMGTWRWDIVGGAIQWSEEVGPLFDQPAGYVPRGFDGYAQLVHPEDPRRRGRANGAQSGDPCSAVRWLRLAGRSRRNRGTRSRTTRRGSD